jgi:RND family efflux transporter MFP subunit
MRVPRPKGLFPVLGVGLCLSLFAGCAKRATSQENSATAALPRAAVATVKSETISNTFSTVGEFVPYQEVALHGKVAGYIQRISVDIGDRVRAGQVLAVLEVPELNAQVLGANAGVRHSTEEITRAKSEIMRAEANHAAVHAAAMRLEQAAQARPRLIAQQELDDAQAKDRETEAQVAVARSALSAAQQQLEVSKASAQQVSAMEGYARIVAPFDGVVTWRYADTGSLIQAGTSNSSSEPVVRVAQVNVLRLRVPVPESLAASVQNGDVADIRVQATGEQFQAKVARSTDSFDRSTRSMQVEIDLPNAKGKLAPGMYADVSLRMREKPNALTIPIQALKREADRASVLVLGANDTGSVRTVRTGLETPDRVEILTGVEEGERVIVGNLAAYQAGQRVLPRPIVVAMNSSEGND